MALRTPTQPSRVSGSVETLLRQLAGPFAAGGPGDYDRAYRHFAGAQARNPYAVINRILADRTRAAQIPGISRATAKRIEGARVGRSGDSSLGARHPLSREIRTLEHQVGKAQKHNRSIPGLPHVFSGRFGAVLRLFQQGGGGTGPEGGGGPRGGELRFGPPGTQIRGGPGRRRGASSGPTILGGGLGNVS